jgi:hypothetical protein
MRGEVMFHYFNPHAHSISITISSCICSWSEGVVHPKQVLYDRKNCIGFFNEVRGLHA